VGYGVTQISIIFQLYLGGQFYWEKTLKAEKDHDIPNVDTHI
jgi:hypothetical protein